MFIALIYLLSTIITPAPLVSLAVDPQSHPDHLDVVVHILNSDSRYQDFAVSVAGITTAITAPLSEVQTITTTIPLDLPPICNARTTYTLIVSARVLTDTVPFSRTEVGGVVERPCPLRLYVP